MLPFFNSHRTPCRKGPRMDEVALGVPPAGALARTSAISKVGFGADWPNVAPVKAAKALIATNVRIRLRIASIILIPLYQKPMHKGAMLADTMLVETAYKVVGKG
jgi:hypothetical protein